VRHSSSVEHKNGSVAGSGLRYSNLNKHADERRLNSSQDCEQHLEVRARAEEYCVQESMESTRLGCSTPASKPELLF